MNETPDARLRLLWFAAALAAMIVIAFIKTKTSRIVKDSVADTKRWVGIPLRALASL